MKRLSSIASFEILSKEEQIVINGGNVGCIVGGWSCKSGNSSASSDCWASVQAIRNSASASCVNQGGVGSVWYFDEPGESEN